MKRSILLLCALCVVLGGSRIAAAESSSCAEPTIEARYSDSELEVVLIADFSGCRWARHGVSLHGWIEGKGTLTSGGGESVGGCFDECEFPVSMPHGPEITGTYDGRFKFDWKKSKKTLPFHFDCTTQLGCS